MVRAERKALRLTTLGLLTLVSAFAAPAAASASHRSAKTVRFHGYSVEVPAAWPVFALARDPTTCVRFNRHAIYLGRPGKNQRCPAHAVGRTEAILIEPLAASGASAQSGAGPALPSPANEGAQPHQAQLAVPSRGVRVVATWGRDRGLIKHALGGHAPPAVARRPASATAAQAATAGGVFTGIGFDPCSAPSAQHMTAWRSSPYRAVGVYIGGANMACSQPNLTSSWVHTESHAGWHLIPTYVGLQPPGNSCGCAAINPGQAPAQGAAAASDAAAQARALGLGRGNPIYDDMEAYSRGGTATSAVRAFLSAWTARLHALGYKSGVYSSAASGISDLVAAYGTGYLEPDDIWIGDWNGRQTTSDPYVPSGDWANHQRLHQYRGGHNETYGGVTINIDNDYLDGATGGASVAFADGTFVQVSGSTLIYRVAGGAPLYVNDWNAVGGPQPFTVISQQQFDSLNSVPFDGTFLETSTGAIYRTAGGAPLSVSSWSLFGGPQPSVTIDQWDIDNVSNPLAHLNAVPANGTIVEGLPSRSFWVFEGGDRQRTSSDPGATQVDDLALAAFRVRIPPPPKCVVPPLKRSTLGQARRRLRRAHCRLGKVHRLLRSGANHTLHVIGQAPRPHGRYGRNHRVAVTLA